MQNVLRSGSYGARLYIFTGVSEKKLMTWAFAAEKAG